MTTMSVGKKEALYELVEVPERFGPVTLTVDQAKVRSYAFAQGDFGAWYFDSSPFGAPVGHPLVLANDLLFLFYEAYDGNTAQGLHTHESLRFHAPVPVGENVTITGAYVDKYERRGQGYVVLQAEARGADGRLLVSHEGREIMRTKAGEVVGKRRAEPAGRRVEGTARADLQPLRSATDTAELLQPIAGPTRSFDQDQLMVFSWGGKGYANVHTHVEKARASGLDRTIVQAQQQTGLIIEAMTALFGASWFTSGALDLRFVHPAFVDDVLTVGGAVVGTDSDRLELEVWIDKNTGERTALGWASADLAAVTAGPTPLLNL